LNLVASESGSARTTIADIASEPKPQDILAELKKLKTLNLPSHQNHKIEFLVDRTGLTVW